MQRTAALLEASQQNDQVLSRDMRVEVWLSSNVKSLVYRMLVLNTTQIPWTLGRQLTVVYDPLLREIKERVPSIEKLITLETPGRRVSPAQYPGEALIELYLAFSLRKTNVDQTEALSEEFSRLDLVENLSDDDFHDQFYLMLGMLADLDRCFSRFDSGSSDKFAKGRNIFDSQPARVGFVVAIANHVLGRAGQDRPSEDRARRLKDTHENLSKLVAVLGALEPSELGEFLQLDILREVVSKRVGQVGRFERAVFFEAFKVMIEDNHSLSSMEACWRAH